MTVLENMGDISQIVTFRDIESLYVILDVEPLLWTRLVLEWSLGVRSHIGAGDRAWRRRWAGTNSPTKLVDRLGVTDGRDLDGCS